MPKKEPSALLMAIITGAVGILGGVIGAGAVVWSTATQVDTQQKLATATFFREQRQKTYSEFLVLGNHAFRELDEGIAGAINDGYTTTKAKKVVDEIQPDMRALDDSLSRIHLLTGGKAYNAAAAFVERLYTSIFSFGTAHPNDPPKRLAHVGSYLNKQAKSQLEAFAQAGRQELRSASD